MVEKQINPPIKYTVAQYAAEARVLRTALKMLVQQISLPRLDLALLIHEAAGTSVRQLLTEGEISDDNVLTGTSEEGVDIGLMAASIGAYGACLTTHLVTGRTENG